MNSARIIRIDACEDCPYVMQIHQGQTLICTNHRFSESIIGLTKENPSIPNWCPLEKKANDANKNP